MRIDEAILYMTLYRQKLVDSVSDLDKDIEAYDMAIKALKQGDMLDKIRAEIEQTTSRYTISRERDARGQVEWSDKLIKESEVLEILDKYKAEVKPQESEVSE